MSCISNIIRVTTSPVKECATTLQCPPMVGPGEDWGAPGDDPDGQTEAAEA